MPDQKPSRMLEFPFDTSLAADAVPSPNHDERQGGPPDIILLHYTGMESAEAALERLCDPKARVSSHYFVHEDGRIIQMVPEARRAWHAGVSSWAGETDINSRSIGIEIVNPGHDFGYPDFPIRQIAADPGEKFPWRLLFESGVGLWVEPAPITDWLSLVPGDSGTNVRELQQSLADYGYGIAATGEYDANTKQVVTAFQRHFRPAQIDGLADTSTRETLRRLTEARARMPAPKPPLAPLKERPAAS
jgi:N-acetylmuramoyl-L-alanine amidase